MQYLSINQLSIQLARVSGGDNVVNCPIISIFNTGNAGDNVVDDRPYSSRGCNP